MKAKREVLKRRRVITFLVIMFFVILLTNHKVMVGMGLNAAKRVNKQTIGYVEEKLRMYDDYLREDGKGITLDGIFGGMMIDKDGILLISKGDKILATNKKVDLSIENCREFCKNGEVVERNNNFKKIKYMKKRWYIEEANYQDYTIYILLSVNEVYHQYYITALAIMVIYFLLCGSIGGIASYFERKNYKNLDKYYRIIDAVSSVFMGNLLINLDTTKAEWIKIPDSVKKRLQNSQRADKILRNISEEYVSELYREEYLRFTDIHTIRERRCQKYSYYCNDSECFFR